MSSKLESAIARLDKYTTDAQVPGPLMSIVGDIRAAAAEIQLLQEEQNKTLVDEVELQAEGDLYGRRRRQKLLVGQPASIRADVMEREFELLADRVAVLENRVLGPLQQRVKKDKP